MDARFFRKEEGGKVRCELCPHRCLIAPGRHGICRVRFNQDGVLRLPYYGRLSSIAVDPIEKKPLYHFFPGRGILSVGFWGCSFHCPFCQNHAISQTAGSRPAGDDSETIMPQNLVELAVAKDSLGISYTYSEPIVHLEYVLETARAARERGLKNVLVSNGYINPEPAELLIEAMDAANIDLKSFNADFYRREIGGDLEEVKRFLGQVNRRIALEVTTLVIPGKNDSEEEIQAIASFLAGLDPDIPYHLSAYYPQYRYTIPPTPAATLRRLAEVARRSLRYVYLGNIGLEESNTACPRCGKVIVRRRGYHVSLEGLKDGTCRSCGAPAPIRGA